jgi:hypothetical protein
MAFDNQEYLKNSRNRVLDFLEYTSSVQLQQRYKRVVPFVEIPRELKAQWDAYFPKNPKGFKGAWTDKESAALLEFEKSFRLLVGLLPKPMPDVPEIFENSNWKLIMKLAETTLRELYDTRDYDIKKRNG